MRDIHKSPGVLKNRNTYFLHLSTSRTCKNLGNLLLDVILVQSRDKGKYEVIAVFDIEIIIFSGDIVQCLA